jgi:delta 1-pyrroline-5-carboxylate dehydrogenase
MNPWEFSNCQFFGYIFGCFEVPNSVLAKAAETCFLQFKKQVPFKCKEKIPAV